MSFFGKSLGHLTSADLANLLENKVPESRTLDYKRELPGNSDDAKKEFLADVSAMANTMGGMLLYGVDEETDQSGRGSGVPQQNPCGITIDNEDKLKLRLQDIVRDGLNPRLTNIDVRAFTVKDKAILALSVPRSLFAPHAIWFQKSGKFFRRNDSGKYQVDPAELRQMYNAVSLWQSQMETFRRDRISRIEGGEVLPNLAPAPYVLLHILPYGRLDESVDILPTSAGNLAHSLLQTSPFPLNDYNTNFDGFIGYQVSRPPSQSQQYVQAFTFGGLEHYSAGLFLIDGTDVRLNGLGVEKLINDAVSKSCELIRNKWNISAPFAVLLTIVGAKGMRAMKFTQFYGEQNSSGTLQHSPAMFPALVLPGDAPHTKELEPLVKHFWRAFGELPDLP